MTLALPPAPMPLPPPAMPPVIPVAPAPWMPGLALEPDQPLTGVDKGGFGTGWQQWWRYNGDHYLDLRRAVVSGIAPTTGGEEVAGAGYRPTQAQIRETVVPALEACLREASSDELVRGALIALARIEGTDVERSALFYLSKDHQPSVEAALVALGLSADSNGDDILLALLQNGEEGRALRGGARIDSRTRVFATYGLGLLAGRTQDGATIERIGKEVTRTLVTDESATFEHHVALLLVMGLAPLAECDGTIAVELSKLGESEAHFCRGTQIVALLDYFEDEERSFELRAHAAVPLARLTVGANPEYKETVAKALIAAIGARSKEEALVRHSSATALGILGDGDDDSVDEKIREALLASASRGEDLERCLALVAAARSAARPGDGKNSGRGLARVQDQLEKHLATGRGDISAWAALSLSLLGWEHMQASGALPDGLMSSLRDGIYSRSEERAAAATLGAGVLRDRDACASVAKRLGRQEPEAVRSYAALSLGMIGARDSDEALRKILAEEDLSPALRGSVAIALRLLGDEQAAQSLFDAAQDAEEIEEKTALVSAAGVLGDSAAIEPMIALLRDEQGEPKLRGAAALALGVLCDQRAESWTSSLSSDINYNVLTWSLQDPFGDGLGVLDMR